MRFLPAFYLSFAFLDKIDEFFHIVKVVIITHNSLAVIDNAVFLVALQAIQQHLLSIPFGEQSKTVRFYFGQETLPARFRTIEAMAVSAGKRTGSVFTLVQIGAFIGVASMAVRIFRAQTAGKPATSDS